MRKCEMLKMLRPLSVSPREWACVATRGRPAPSCLGGQERIILEMLEIGYIGKIQKAQYLNKSFEPYITLSSSCGIAVSLVNECQFFF